MLKAATTVMLQYEIVQTESHQNDFSKIEKQKCFKNETGLEEQSPPP